MGSGKVRFVLEALTWAPCESPSQKAGLKPGGLTSLGCIADRRDGDRLEGCFGGRGTGLRNLGREGPGFWSFPRWTVVPDIFPSRAPRAPPSLGRQTVGWG